MSQGVMQFKSRFFVAVALFVVFVLFAFFFGMFRTRFVSIVMPSAVAVRGGVVVKGDVATASVLNDVHGAVPEVTV